ncbi:MAG: TRAP transporter small permease subunit, partial [Haliea sp.]
EKGVHVLVAAFSALLLVESLSLTLRNFARHQLSPALQIEIGWIYLAVPFGSFLLFLAAIEALVTRRVNNSSSAL